MKLIDLKLTNFKKLSALPNPTIAFNSDINVLVGANNAGKTSVLKAIQKLFRTDNINVAKDLNYLTKDGNLLIEANIQLAKEQWVSFLRLALGALTNIPINTVNVDQLADKLYPVSIKLRHNMGLIDRKQSTYSITGDIDETEMNAIGFQDNSKAVIRQALNQFAGSDFYNVYKTPLYLDSKGEVMEREPFVALSQIENQRNQKQINIRGLLYSLKKKELAKFNNFKKRLLEIFTELQDIDIINNEDLGQFELVLHEKLRKNGETENVKYDINNVGQGMQSLVIILSTILLLKPSIVLMDEPEVHMHPSLIKEFVKYIKLLSSETQFIITSHSVVLMHEVGLDKIFSMKNEVDQKGIIANKVDDRNKLFEAISSLGYEIDSLTYTMKPTVFVFTEGPSDKNLILSFAHKAELNQQINSFTTAFVSMDGKGNRYKLANLIDKLNEEFIESPLIMILDRDETTNTTIEEIRKKFFSKNQKRLHYLNKRQIENYLIDAVAINKAVTSKIKDVVLLARWNKENIPSKIVLLAEEQKDKILNNYLSELFIADSLINTKQLGEILKSFKDKPLNQSVPEFTGELFKLIGMRTSELGQKTNSALSEFDAKWDLDKVEMCDGRELLTSIRRWIQDEYKVSNINYDDIIDSMDKIPDEISTLLTQLTKPEELKIIAKN